MFSETTLTFIAGSAGYKKNGKWYFSITDHLGTPRVVFSEDGIVQERNTFYPSGLQIDAAKLHARHDVFLLPPQRH